MTDETTGQSDIDTLYPVILHVPDDKKKRSVRETVSYLSLHARRALFISAGKSRLNPGRLLKDQRGAPLPCNGVYWSVTHKPEYVGAVVASTAVGIDVEKIRPCSEALLKRTADNDERRLFNGDDDLVFFRYWTGKEAVIKSVGTGVYDAAHCRVVNVIDDRRMELDYQNNRYGVEHLFFNGHIASVVKTAGCIEWTLL